MRLGDIDAVKEKLLHDSFCSWHDFNTVMHALDEAPTIDAVPVKHGRWLEDEKAYPGPDLSNYVCSSCKRVGGTWIKGLKPENLFTYCPWCGAKMDGEKVGE